MAIKTFNIDHEIYKKFAEHCKQQGISMSKKVENFIKSELEKLSSQTSQLQQVKSYTAKPQLDVEHSFKKYC